MAYRRFQFPLFAAILVVLGLIGCDSSGTDINDPDPVDVRPLTTQESRLVEADNAFGLNLFRSISAEEADQNVFISPLSVSMALGMTLNGAEGETQAQMEAVLGKQGLTETEINEAYQSLTTLLTGIDPAVRFDIANSIWTREGFAVEPAFIEANQTYFDAEVQSLDFAAAEALDTINGWVKDKTEGTIEEVLDEIPADAVMYLINALYYKANWRWPFDEDKTQDDVFITEDGAERPIKMMRAEEMKLLAYYADTFMAVDLPYGDSLYSMTILQPYEGETIADLVATLDAETWATILDNLTLENLGFVHVPRFTLEYEKGLKDVLIALGMEDAFAPGRADFSGINGDGGLYISRVIHKTHLAVDEAGTEASAVTAVEIRETSVPPHLRLDRPFVFSIRERTSGTILFIGQLMDPGV